MLDEIDVQIQRYLLATLGSNVLVALFTWLAFSALGMEQAGVWGITAGILHFIPYLGPVLFAIISGMAGFMQFGTALQALSIAGGSAIDSHGGWIHIYDMAAELLRARQCNRAVHCLAVLRLDVGNLGPIARRVLRCHCQGNLRSHRIAKAVR